MRAVNDLTDLLDATRRIAAQTRQRMAGTTPEGATRRVSLHDPDARPIAKGRLGKPVEFGAKAQVCDNADGIVLDHDVQPGNPADAPRLKPAVERVEKRTGQTPRTVAADATMFSPSWTLLKHITNLKILITANYNSGKSTFLASRSVKSLN